MVPFLLFISGAVSICGGAWMVYHPAAPVVAGVFLIFVSVKLMVSGKE